MGPQPLLGGFARAYPDIQIELTHHEGHVDIVEGGFDAGIRLSDSVQKDMIAVPLGGPISVCVVGSPAYLKRHPAPTHPAELTQHNCVRFRFSTGGGVYR